MTPRKNRKSDDRGKAAAGQVCPSCAVAVLAEARFCHACGAALQAVPGGGKWSSGILAWVGAFAILGAVAVLVVMTLNKRDGTPPSPGAFSSAPPAASSGSLPDLSRMTPRQAADRLFNRTMMASEKGDRAEALRFAPMAIQAYGVLPALDRDAHYHLGLIHGVAGDRANVERQIAALKQGASNHLLALMLEHGIAKQSGDKAAASRLLAAFAAAYAAEIATAKPEYQAHRNTIEGFRGAAVSPVAPSSASEGKAGSP